VGAVTAAEQPVPMARLLAMSYRLMIDGLHNRLPAAGFTDVRPAYGFVLLATRGSGTTTVELAKLLGVTKQAASKLLGSMEAGGYVRRSTNATDGRIRNIELAERGEQLLVAVESIYAELEQQWAGVIGAPAVEQIRTDLSNILLAANKGQFPMIRPTP
jgi:DNA-binding MarR family transcriptional regulator